MVLIDPDDFVFPMTHKKFKATSRYALEHRVILARYLGRLLEPWEVVHHKNGIKADNRIENLELLPSDDNHKYNHLVEKRMKAYINELEQQIELLKATITGFLEENHVSNCG